MTMPNLHARLTIERLGQRGEGIARGENGLLFVPYTVPGDVIAAEVDGERARLGEVLTPGPDRIAAFCPHFTICGGCAVQTLAAPAYQDWKRGLVVAALEHARVTADVGALVDAHGEGRRRATFHARFTRHGSGRMDAIVGFMQARQHTIIEIDDCPILAPSMRNALSVARGIAMELAEVGKPLDILVTATIEGLDVDFRGSGPLEPALRQRLVEAAARLDLSRLSNHGDVIIERRIPLLQMGAARVSPPPGAFLQATEAGEEALGRLVLEAVGKARKVADLFAGVGTFTLRLAAGAEVLALESDAASVQALARAAHMPGLRTVNAQARDLFRRPLAGVELEPFEAVVFDPPRAGAEVQAKALAASNVPTVVGVSCSAQTFARDAKILVDGGYALESVAPVDQFRHSPHVEIVGVFRKQAPKGRKRGRLLG